MEDSSQSGGNVRTIARIRKLCASGLTVKYGYRQFADTDQAVFFTGDPCFP